ncbi:MAG: hypothetical protein IJ274_06720 [Lachnospiraceae bacterium]|nr:hypothetical protein [Lachnospiraceae bacterium]
MIAFLLGLLKVIGILLLVILILLLFIVGIVLFVPIRYGGSGQITKDIKKASASVTWLLKAVQCNVAYTFPEKPVICIKILGIDIMKLLEKKNSNDTQNSQKSSKKTNAAVKKKKTSKKTVPGVNTSLLDEPQHPQAEPSILSTPTTEKPNLVQTASGNASSHSSASKDDGKQEQKKAKKEKKTKAGKAASQNAPKDVPEDAPKNKVPLKDKIQTTIDKIKYIIYNIKYYIAILQEEDTKQLIANAWEAILKILKNIRPREFVVKGKFGFDSPDTTGKVYGMYAVVMPLLHEHVVLEPDFEQQIMEGEASLKGHITIFVIVVNALRILFDKRLQPLIKKLKRGGNKNGR